MVRVRVIEADDILPPLAPFALDPNQFPRVDVVPVVGRVGACIAAARGRGNKLQPIIRKTAQQNAAAFVRVSLFPMSADRIIVFAGELEHAHFALKV
jgi:hypothetical protein